MFDQRIYWKPGKRTFSVVQQKRKTIRYCTLKPSPIQTPLTETIPELASIPRLNLVDAPTPLLKYSDLGQQIRCQNFWIKEDNLSSSIYGGNKPRKLEYSLARVLANGFKSVVTTGAIGTHHGLATAIFSNRFGLSCHLVLFEQPVTRRVRLNLFLLHKYKAALHFASNYLQVPTHIARLLLPTVIGTEELRMTLLEAGGTSTLSNLGFVNAVFELRQQISELQIQPPSYIFCPVGTGGTMAGLLLGCKLCHLPTQVIGVRVVDRIMANRYRIVYLANRTLHLIKRYSTRINLSAIHPNEVTIMQNFFGGHYGSVTAIGKKTVELAQEHGVILETTYTAKAFAGLIDFIRNNPPDSRPIIFWNTFNSQPLSASIGDFDYRELPQEFHRFFRP